MLQAASALPAGGSIVVLRGQPSDEELAAVVAALDASGMGSPVEAHPRWLVAARREALGGRPVAVPADLPVSARFA